MAGHEEGRDGARSWSWELLIHALLSSPAEHLVPGKALLW